MPIEQRPSIDVAILAGRVPHKDRLYAIGPFAERVSFASQQRRAMNLICAIHDEICRSGDDAGLKGKSACVVGAGLAGLTCSIALAAFNCTNWILEASHRPLNTTRHAKHREIHPTINFWPRETVSISTELPFMNWYQDRCDLLMARLLDKWERFATRSEIMPITYRSTVTGVQRKSGKWQVTTTGTASPVQDFDLVIFATGFGLEKIVMNSGSPAYWSLDGDRIDAIRDASPPVVKNFVVGGTGDGGLIEVLRLLYRNFQAGRVSYGTEATLENDWILRTLREIEGRVKLRVSDYILHEGFPVDPKTKDEIARALWEEYASIYVRLGARFRQSLEEQRTALPKVILIGKRATPAEHTASPYHRLLIMHAIHEGWVEYYQHSGSVVVADCSAPGDHRDADRLLVKRKHVSFRGRKSMIGDGGSVASKRLRGTMSLENCFFINRYGTDSPLKDILDPISPDLIDQVKKRQLLYADQDWISLAQASDLAERLGCARPDEPVNWLFEQMDEARMFFRDRYRLRVQDEVVEGTPRLLLYTGNGNDRRWSDVNEAGPIPEHFFGVPIDRTKVVTIPLASRTGH
ncbi:hypothetical protein OF829_12590 [Sphingomonas sp. LB-2]|uniref:hypothetical protein n=1 Tax=Sphingomonas caeni TaxID=2984949 RepID=UPI0022316668|nr:hypothetical protein [Sphingomonas caeni]MCW3848080.1 hypothetical protein [Sphingomonas caeni]